MLKTSYPWTKLRPSEGFFVPALDVEKVRERGLSAAVSQKVKYPIKTTVGIEGGLIGVWFHRVR